MGSKNEYMKKLLLELMMINSWLIGTAISTQTFTESSHPLFQISINLVRLRNSSIFDQFVTDAMNDFEQFSKQKAEDNAKN